MSSARLLAFKQSAHVALLVSFLGLSGCAIVGTDYEPPETSLPDQFHHTPSKAASNDEAMPVRWWENFDDPLLNDLIGEAALHNKDVLQALSRINQSRALANVAFTNLLPGARLSGFYERGKSSAARFPGGGNGFDFEVYNGSVDASWELDIFGRLQRELEARNAEHHAAVAELYDALLMTMSEIADVYIQLRSTEVQLTIAEKNVSLQDDLLKLTQTKYQFGSVSNLDVTRAKTQLAQTKSLIPALKAKRMTSLHRLAILCGQQPDTLYDRITQASDPRIPRYKGPLTIGNPNDLLRRRPDIRRAERILASKHAGIGVAEGELYPKIIFEGSLGFEASSSSNLRDSKTYGFGPQITWSILDTGKLRSQINIAEEETKEALLAFEKSVLTALEDVENALVSFQSEKEKLIDLKAAFDASKESYKIARLQYDQGALDFLSVLDTQRTLLDTENAFTQSKEALTQSLIRIYKSLGGGWEAYTLSDDAILVEASNTEIDLDHSS